MNAVQVRKSYHLQTAGDLRELVGRCSKYGHKRAQERGYRTASHVQRKAEYRVIFAIFIVLISLLLFGLSSEADETGTQLHKYYTSVLVKDAESLNELAAQYADAEHYRNLRMYYREVREINHLPMDDPDTLQIAPGNYIILPYYSAEYSF